MLESTFSIKLLKNPESKEFIKGITLYNNTTPIDIKTNSNEIIYWTQNKSAKFKIFSFALYLNHEMVGYAMTSYIFSQKLLIYDYIALENSANNTLFLAYVNLIKTFFSNAKLDINYYVVEISNKNHGKEQDKESKLFLKFLCIENFAKIDVQYNSPPLGINNNESSFEAYLYIKSVNDRKTISKESFLSLINALYRDYYLAWYQPFFNINELDHYTKLIDDSLEQVTELLKKEERINILHKQCDSSLKKNNGTTDLPVKGTKKTLFIAVIIAIALILPIIIVSIYNILLQKMNIELTAVSSLLGGLGGAIISGVITISIFISQKKDHNL